MMKFLFPALATMLLVPAIALAQTQPNFGGRSPAPPRLVPASASPLPNPLPLREVALFSSGVGYFGRAGQISGETSVPLTVHAPQIADLLKSLVLFDPKGAVKPVTYSLQDYLAQRQSETDLNLGAQSSPGALLQAFQGAMVRLEKPSGAVEGRILSVSSRRIKEGDAYLDVEHLSLLTGVGVQTVRLDDVTSFRLLDPSLDAKLRATLEQKAANLTSKLDDGARSVTLHFAGTGARQVRAGYLLETPAWKTSYRLVLEAGKKPYLQGWAIVENTTDDDWNGVKLSLISGRPISFIQDLAAPVYVARPVVAPLILGSAQPQTFGQGFAGTGSTQLQEPVPQSRLDALESRPVGALENRADMPQRLQISPSTLHGTGNENYVQSGGRGGFAAAQGAKSDVGFLDYNGAMARDAITSDALRGGASSQAQSGERGELFEYAIAGGTSIPRGQAAMVPIVSTDIEGQAVTIAESSLRPGEIPTSNGFSLRNSSGLHLQGGPITVFSGGIYAGDALVSNLSPKDGRLIAYARDLEVVAIQNQPDAQNVISKISLSDGVLHVVTSQSNERSWNFKNKGAALKTVVLQVPDEPGWKLADPKQLDEKTANAQRFRFGIKPGDTVFKAKWNTQSEETYVVFDADVSGLEYFTRQNAISPALKAKLLEVVAQKKRLNDIAGQRAAQEAILKDIEDDQTRIRGNMAPLDKTGKLFKSYEAKLGAQEVRVEATRAEITRLRAAEAAAKTALRDLVSGLDLV